MANVAFRFDYLRVGKSLRTDRMIQIYDGEGNVVGHIDDSFGEWLLHKLGPGRAVGMRKERLLYDDLDDAVGDAKAHRRSIAEGDVYEKHITHHP